MAIFYVFSSVSGTRCSLSCRIYVSSVWYNADRQVYTWAFGNGADSIVLNIYLTRNRKYYYNVSIAASWIAFVLWEVYEWIYATYNGPSDFIQTKPWDMAIDLWIDSLGALAICFLCDEFTEG
jgi:polyferredoxin